MLGELRPDRVNHLLHLGTVGRVGCHAGGRTYIVPIAYLYDGSAIYGSSFEGLKLRMMRENPEVCFEVENFTSLRTWETVVVQGRFEELRGEEAAAARSRLVNHFRGLGLSWLRTPPSPQEEGWARVHRFAPAPGEAPVVYRIVPLEMSGRFERETQGRGSTEVSGNGRPGAATRS